MVTTTLRCHMMAITSQYTVNGVLMAEPTGGAATLLTLKYVWGILMVPIGWLWWRVRDVERRQLDLPTRREVKEAITDATKPIDNSVTEVKGDVKEMRHLLTEMVMNERSKR